MLGGQLGGCCYTVKTSGWSVTAIISLKERLKASIVMPPVSPTCWSLYLCVVNSSPDLRGLTLEGDHEKLRKCQYVYPLSLGCNTQVASALQPSVCEKPAAMT